MLNSLKDRKSIHVIRYSVKVFMRTFNYVLAVNVYLRMNRNPSAPDTLQIFAGTAILGFSQASEYGWQEHAAGTL